MTNQRFYGLVTTLTLLLSYGALTSESVNAQSRSRFYCAVSAGKYTTFVETSRGKKPMIAWVSGSFDAEGWTHEKRCKTVSARFQQYNANGKLRNIRTDTINNYPVICVTSRKGERCLKQDVLITLKQGTDAQEILNRLFDTRNLEGGAPIQMSTGHFSYDESGELNVDVDKYMDELFNESPSPNP